MLGAIESISRLGRNAMAFCKANSPKILLAGGFVGIGAGIGFTVWGTLKAKKKMDELVDLECEICDRIDVIKDDGEIFTEEEAGRVIIGERIRTGARIAVDYLPAIVCTGVGVGCIIASHNIQAKRIALISAAYNTLLASYNEYRAVVASKYGDESERELWLESKKAQDAKNVEFMKLHGLTDDEILEMLDLTRRADPSMIWWAPETTSSGVFSKYANENITKLKNLNNYWTNRLQAEGYLFKSQVLKDLGIDPAQYPASFMTGWIYDGKKGSDIVDINLYGPQNEDHWTMGIDSGWYLTFNDHGIIINKLELLPPSSHIFL